MSPKQFFIISVITIMVQSAPVKRDTDENQTAMTKDVQNKLNTLYCAAQSVQRTAVTLKERLNRATVLNESDINSDTKEVINETFDHFSSKCRDFTLAMSLKHQLQDYLFNQDLNDEDVKQLSSLLVALQTIANILDQLQFYKNSSNCPRLSSTEYKMMYQVQYSTNNNNITLLLEPIIDWVRGTNYEADTKPNPNICEEKNLFTA